MIRVIIKTKNEEGKSYSAKIDEGGIHPNEEHLGNIFFAHMNSEEPMFEYYAETPKGREMIGILKYKYNGEHYILVKNTTPFKAENELPNRSVVSREAMLLGMNIYSDLLNIYKSTYLGESLDDAVRKLKKENPNMPSDYWFIIYITKRKHGYYKGWKIYKTFENAKNVLLKVIKKSPIVLFGYTFKRKTFYFVITNKRIKYCVYNKYVEAIEKEEKIKSLKDGLEELVLDVKGEKETSKIRGQNKIRKVKASVGGKIGEYSIYELYKKCEDFEDVTIYKGDKKILDIKHKGIKNPYYDRVYYKPYCVYIDPDIKKITDKLTTEVYDFDLNDFVTRPIIDPKTGRIFDLWKLMGAVYSYLYRREKKKGIEVMRTYERWEGLVAPQTIPSKEGVIFVRVILERRGGIEYYDVSVRGKDTIKRLVEIIKEAFSHNAVAVVFSIRIKRHIKAIFVVSRKGTEAILYDLRTDEFVKKKTSIRNAIKMVMGNVG